MTLWVIHTQIRRNVAVIPNITFLVIWYWLPPKSDQQEFIYLIIFKKTMTLTCFFTIIENRNFLVISRESKFQTVSSKHQYLHGLGRKSYLNVFKFVNMFEETSLFNNWVHLFGSVSVISEFWPRNNWYKEDDSCETETAVVWQVFDKSRCEWLGNSKMQHRLCSLWTSPERDFYVPRP